AMLRAMPNVVTLRPADASETAEAWRVAIERLDGPTVLLLTRQNLPSLDRSVFAPAEGLRKGAYVLRDAEGGAPEIVLIATGSEVAVALAAQDALAARGVRARVVSMPSWELFDAQPASYRDSVLPPGVKRLAVEAGSSMGWHKYVGIDGDIIALDHFGASAPAEVLAREFGFTPENVTSRALRLLGRG
ncbi:MAG TPA: transketolase C-terminal domain-containing protein, partial [Armatimonadota bacterium]|nr:transketolase C-terminal domain-containing protein [Armatimonadota bacterium]